MRYYQCQLIGKVVASYMLRHN